MGKAGLIIERAIGGKSHTIKKQKNTTVEKRMEQ